MVTSNKELITAAGFVYGVSKADIDYAMAAGNFNGKGLQYQLALIADSVIARTTGINPFPEVATYAQSFDWKKIFNNGTFFWVGAEFAKALTSNKLVHDLAGIGQPFAAGYAIGKLFDPPSGNVGASSYSPRYEGSASGESPFLGAYR